MDSEHLSKLAAALDSAAKGTAEPIIGLCSADVIWRLSGNHVLAGEYVGPEAVGEVVEKLGKFPAGVYTAEPEATLVDGDLQGGFVLAVTRREVARPGVEPIEWRSFDIVRLADGQIQEMWTFASPEDGANAGLACPVPAAS